MFSGKTNDARPFGVPLDNLASALEDNNLKATREGNSLIVRRPSLSTRVDVIRPANRESQNGLIAAVVQLRTAIPEELEATLSKPTTIVKMNRMATLGALTADGGKLFVGSRLTILESENTWDSCDRDIRV